MRLRFHWRMTVYFVLLSLLLIGIYGSLYFLMKISWFWSSFFALLPVSFFAYVMFKSLAYPIQRMTEVVRGLTTDHQIGGIYPYDELSDLSRAIDEIASQLRKKIDEVSVRVSASPSSNTLSRPTEAMCGLKVKSPRGQHFTLLWRNKLRRM